MKIAVKDLNKFLTCSLCNGYFRECHTIPECMHSFCKPCLIRHLYPDERTTRFFCPTCNVGLGQRPFTKIVFDRNIQAIVDKLYPIMQKKSSDAIEDEMNNIVKHALEHPSKKARTDGTEASSKEFTLIRVIPKEGVQEDKQLPALTKSSFQMKLNVNMKKVKKEIAKRLGVLNCVIEGTDLAIFLNNEELNVEMTVDQCLALATDKDNIIISYSRK